MLWFGKKRRQEKAELEKLIRELKARRQETYVDGRGEIVAAHGKPAQYTFRYR